jgi:phosphoribosylformylglycinamidine synthase subunit PurS
MAKVKISIMLKPALLDAQGRVVQGALHALGYEEVEKVRVGKNIEIDVPDSTDLDLKVKEMCEKLLANPVIEDFTYEVSPAGVG